MAQGRSDAAPGQTREKPAKSQPARSQSGKGQPGSSRASQSGIASPITAVGATSAPAASPAALIYYGSWLDDASMMAPGDVWVGLSTGYWSGDGHRQIDAPVASAAVGVNRRMLAGGSVSFYHFRDAEGLTETGPGSISLYAKFLIVDPATTSKGIGVAVTPLMEVSPGGGRQLGWALPVNVEARRGQMRVYGSAGYFSRGSTFATAAVDLPLGPRASVTGTFGQSYARAGTHQTSLGIGTFLMMTPASGVFVGVGQTFMPAEIGPGGLSFAGGLSFLLPQPKRP